MFTCHATIGTTKCAPITSSFICGGGVVERHSLGGFLNLIILQDGLLANAVHLFLYSYNLHECATCTE